MEKTNLQSGFAPIVIAVIVLVALALGGGVYYSVKKNPNKSPKNPTVESTPSPSISPEFGVDADAQASLRAEIKTGTLRSLLALGKDVVCTFNSGTGASEVSGTMYLSGSMMRGDFSSKGPGGVMEESHMIKQGDVVFTWLGSQGVKLGMSQMNKNASSQNSGSFGLSSIFDQSLNYKCSNWNKDDAKFSPPSDIIFEDIRAMMNGQLKI